MDFGIIIPIPQTASRKNKNPFDNPIHWENFCIPHSIFETPILGVAIPIPNPQEMADYEHWWMDTAMGTEGQWLLRE